MKKKVLITAALPYANGPLHFGHIAGCYLPGDSYARFQRLIGQDVLYICGSDEYGIAITLTAKMAGRTPKEHVDVFHKINSDFFKKLNMSFDYYSRTTSETHVAPTNQFFLDLLKNGYIEESVTNQLYSEEDSRFLADRYVIGTCRRCGFEEARGDECPKCGASYEATDLLNPRSKITGSPLILKPTTHWFLRFDLFKEKLTEWLKTKHWKPNVVHFVQNYVNDLQKRAITRDSDWGIPLPIKEGKGKVFYVWFDAVIGYISATKEWAEKVKKDSKAWEPYWLDPETKLVQFVGKDNIPFHAIFFPAMIMGQDQPYKLVDELPANEFYNLEGKQFSKSSGWYIDLEDFFQKFTADQIRYAIAANAPETQDSEFSWKDFQMRCNTELLGKYGNLANRVLVFIKMQCNSELPSFNDLGPEDQKFLENIDQLIKEAFNAYDQFHLRKASHLVMELAAIGNVYFDAKKPWKAAKQEETRKEMSTTLRCCLECLKALALISYPIIPETAEKLWKLLGYSSSITDHKWDEVMTLPLSATFPTPSILFSKVEDELIDQEIEKLKKRGEEITTSEVKEFEPLKGSVTFDQIENIDLRVGKILSAEPVPKSKKLIKFIIDIGFEKRTIVSGIKEAYPDPTVLVGKLVAVVANLKPAVLMGITSEGMILTAGNPPHLELPTFQDALPGAVIR